MNQSIQFLVYFQIVYWDFHKNWDGIFECRRGGRVSAGILGEEHGFLKPVWVTGKGTGGYGYWFSYLPASKRVLEHPNWTRIEWVMMKTIVLIITHSILIGFGRARTCFDQKPVQITGMGCCGYGYGYRARYPQVYLCTSLLLPWHRFTRLYRFQQVCL